MQNRRSLAQEVLNERSRLFSNVGTGRKRSNGGKSTNSSAAKKRKEGFTLQFLCLASKFQRVVPNSVEKEILNNAGLGRKKIRFNKEDSQKEVCEKIMSGELVDDGNDTEGFPQLSKAGGFELLRSVLNCRELRLIDCPWSARELRKNVNLQATIYVRPIQKCLSTKPKSDVTKNVSNTSSQEFKTTCTRCGLEFSMRKLRQHVESCGVTDEGDEVLNSYDTLTVQEMQNSNTQPTQNVDTQPTQNAHVDTQPTQNAHVVTQPAQNVHVVTQPTQNAYVVTQPAQNAHVVTQPAQNAHVVTQPAQNAHVVTQPAQNAHVVTQPAQNAHVVTQPAQNVHVVTQPA